MRPITLMGTVAAVLSVTTLLTVPASAERICRQVCDEGFCRSRCIERGDRLYMYTKCDEPMTAVEDRPRFAQFLPMETFKCHRCQIALSHGDDDEPAHKAVE